MKSACYLLLLCGILLVDGKLINASNIHMCVCMHVYMYIYMYVNIHECMCVCVCVRM